MPADSQVSTQAEAQAAARERGMLQRQLRGVAERISLATSRLQVEDAASSLTALEQLYQVHTYSAVSTVLGNTVTCCLVNEEVHYSKEHRTRHWDCKIQASETVIFISWHGSFAC